MRKVVCLIVGFLMVGCLTLTNLSCGSSGSDGGGVSTPAASTQATLDEDSVRDTLDFIEENVPACTMDDQAIAQEKRTVRTILGLAGDISDNVILHRSSQATRTAAETMSETIPGTCTTNPGQLVLTLDENESTGAISGSFVFGSFCTEVDDGSGTTETLMVNGTVSISGSVNTTTGDLESLSISTGTGGIAVQIGADTISATLNGLAVSVSGSTTTITMTSLSVAANVDGEATNVTVNSLNATMTENATSMELDASVQIVTEDGSVDIAVVDLMVDDEEQTVLGGELTVAGANGTDIKITYQSASDDFLVEADTNGDGTYDYQPGCMDCSELDVDELLGNLPL